MPAGAGGKPTPCRASQPGSLHCSSKPQRQVTSWSRILKKVGIEYLDWKKHNRNGKGKKCNTENAG